MSIFDNTTAYGRMSEEEQEELREWPHGWERYDAVKLWIDHDGIEKRFLPKAA